MTLSERIDKEYIEAYKAKEAAKVGALRLLKGAMKNKLVELKRVGGSLTDDEALEVIKKQAKQCRDAAEEFAAAGREELAAKERCELAILETYLPRQLSAEELETVIEAAIRKLGATSPRDMGKVIGQIMAEHKNSVDGKALSEAVKKRLTG